MWCYKCGRLISDDSVYCSYCGQRQPDSRFSGGIDFQDADDQHKTYSNKPKKFTADSFRLGEIILGVTVVS